MFLPGKPCTVDSALKFGSKMKKAMIKAEKRKGAIISWWSLFKNLWGCNGRRCWTRLTKLLFF